MQLKQIKKEIKPFLKETFDTIVFVIVMVTIIRFFIGEIRWIPSGSMRPTLIEGDRIFVERFSRFYETPKRGDIMVFYPPFVVPDFSVKILHILSVLSECREINLK